MITNPSLRSIRLLLLVTALIGMVMASLAGCGGGGGSDPGGGTVTAPVIVDQPDSVSIATGENATFTVGATGESLTYQWQKLSSGTYANVSGATSSSYTITSADTDDAGTFRVVVTNSGGTVTSNAATLTVSGSTGDGTVIVD